MSRVAGLRILVFGAMGFLAAGTVVHAACNIVDGKAYGDCTGVRINEGLKGHVIIRSYTSEAGIIEGATVLKGGTLQLNGISNGDVAVHKGARLEVTGIVNGTVNNLGGNVEVEGSVTYIHTIGGQTVIGGSVGGVSGTGPIKYKKGAVVGEMPVEGVKHKAGIQ